MKDDDAARFRALVVDDDAAFRAALARFLAAKGFSVETASAGPEAVGAVRRGGWDLVILDLWMPGMNGLETLVEIRKVDSLVPVIAVSGMGTEATAEACRKAGATGFLAKPLTAEDLREMAAAAEAGRTEREIVAEGGRPGSKGRVLVADDHEGYRTAVARRLRLDGYDVDEVGSGAEAALAAEAIPYGALLLDIHMPGGDGLWAAEMVRARDPYLPILFMTGEATGGEMRRGLSSSTAGCLRKPVEMERLGGMLEFLIASAAASRRRAEARDAYDALPASTRAARKARAEAERIRRSPRTKEYLMAIVVSAIVSLAVLWTVSSAQLRWIEVRRSFEGIPGPGEMYRTIVGYLERDEQRELRPRESDR